MANNNGSGSKPGPSLLERLRDGLLDAFGGQDLRNSGFENEEPDPEFRGGEEPWYG
jgi:hypothetical protein